MGLVNKKLFQKRKEKMLKLSNRNLIECKKLAKEYKLKDENPVLALRDITLSGDDEYGAIKKG